MRKRARLLWVREIFQRRTEMGEYHALISEMRLVDHESFYRYFYMTPQHNLLSLVGPLITHQATGMRSPISAGESGLDSGSQLNKFLCLRVQKKYGSIEQHIVDTEEVGNG